jgi:hypothetical protein
MQCLAPIAALVARSLPGDTLYLDQHRVILGAIMQLVDAGVAPDFESVRAHLRDAGQLDAAGGENRLAEIAATYITLGNLGHHAERLARLAGERRLAQAAQEVALDPANGHKLNALELAISQGGVGVHKSTRLRRLDVDEMARTQPAPVPWLVEGIVVRGTLSVLAGKPGEGKSLVAMAIAAGVSRGEAVAGIACRPGKVLVIDAENGQGEIHRRVHALGPLGDRVEVFEAVGLNLATDLKEVEQAVMEYEPDLLLLDSFRSLWMGRENDSGEVAHVLDRLRNMVRETAVGTLLIHHVGRNPSEYRGSSAIGASTEIGLTLGRAADDPLRHRRRLDCWKCRPAPEPPCRWLEFRTECGVVRVDEAEPPEGHHGPRAQSRATGELATGVVEALAHGPLRQSDLAQRQGRSAGDGSVRRALAALEDVGRVRRREDGSWALASLPPAIPMGPGNLATGNGHPGRDQHTPFEQAAQDLVQAGEAEWIEPHTPLDGPIWDFTGDCE